MSPSSLENPFAPPKQRNPDDAKLVGQMLGSREEEAMRRLVSPKGAEEEPPEDFGSTGELELSEAERGTMAEDKMIGEIIAHERQVLRRFFSREVHVPPLPPEATIEQIRLWESLGLRLHFLPSEDLAQIKRDPTGTITEVTPRPLAAWKKKPNNWFFDQIKAGKLPPSSATLPGGWVLVDTTPKPNYDNGQQMYANDFLGPTLAELNRSKIIKQTSNDGKTLLPVSSRFGLSPKELGDPRVVSAIANTMHLSPEQVTLQREIEFNILGNIHHPEWGETNTSEWFEDSYEAGSGRLFGGGSGNGGLSDVYWGGPTDRFDSIGFRVLGRFSQAET